MKKIRTIFAMFAIIAFMAAIIWAQDVSFLTAEGQSVSLSSQRGNAVVLLFSGAQDPQRRDGLKALESLADRYKGKDVKIFWVSVNSPNEMSNEQLKSVLSLSPSIGVLRDPGQAAFRRFSGKVAQLPTVVVLDRQGTPFGQPRGGFNPNSDFVNNVSSIVDNLLQR